MLYGWVKPLKLALHSLDMSLSLCSTTCSKFIMCCLRVESAMYLRSSSSFEWKMTFISQDLDTRCSYCSYKVTVSKNYLWREGGEMCFYTQRQTFLPIYHLSIEKQDFTLTHSLSIWIYRLLLVFSLSKSMTPYSYGKKLLKPFIINIFTYLINPPPCN